jgi:exopolysaccharide biosynthesis predicted pyruvyltransferase EpsI
MEETGTIAFVDGLRDAAVRAVGAVIGPGSRCALLGYPNHTNPGDLAIWLGAQAILARLGAEVVYECSWRDYSPEALAAAAADGAQIVFTGGGNFGDLWPVTHTLRERVLGEFPGVPFLQLPQSIHFGDAEALARTRRLVARHGNVVLMVRDEMSHAAAMAGSFDADVRLVPDLAFACPLSAAASGPVADIVVIARRDRESRGLDRAPMEPDVWRIDWNLREHERGPLDGESPLPDRVLGLIERNRSLTKRAVDDGEARLQLAAVRSDLARARLDRGCRILRRGRVVVTDSLHAHILGVMLGMATVVTDNSYGKLRATYETFTHAAPLAAWADTPAQALAHARDIHRHLQRSRP